MVWHPFRKEFRMLWRMEINKKISYLAGCAHFFPVSYRSHFKRIIKDLDVTLFEGPLDEGNMDAIRGLSIVHGENDNLLNLIDKDIIRAIEKEFTSFYYKDSFKDYLSILKPDGPSLLKREIEGLSPWMAFFRIWTIYLRNRGWIYSVDLDAHAVARELKKKIYYLETIEEQVSALEAIPVERITRFISFFDRWEEFAKRHALYYKRGELDTMLKSIIEFPTRYKSIIEDRDPILYKRMRPYMEEGNAIAFVGTTHIKGLHTMFQRDGFHVSRVS